MKNSNLQKVAFVSKPDNYNPRDQKCVCCGTDACESNFVDYYINMCTVCMVEHMKKEGKNEKG